MTRSRFHRTILAIGTTLAITASACTQGPSAASPTAAVPTAASSVAAVTRGQGGDLKILAWQPPLLLNPQMSTDGNNLDPARLVIEPLASWDARGKPLANALAAEIPTLANGGVSQDLTTVTWKLRTGVKWSDGTPFTADDVVFTWRFMVDSKTATSGAVDGVKSVVAKDANTAVITYAAPNPNFYQWGVGALGSIIQKAQFKDFVGDKAKDAPGNLKPIGTGPYKVREFKPGDSITYDINENYRDPNKPFFKTVTWKGGGDAVSAARAVFQTGDFDYARNLQVQPDVLLPMVTSSSTGTLITAYGGSVERILLNFANPDPSLGDKRSEPGTKHPYFSDLAVRRALAMATDRKTVAKQLYGDGVSGKASCNLVNSPPAVTSTNTASFDVCTFDLAAANAELDRAGWVRGADGVRAKGGVRLELTYETTVNAVRQNTQDVMKRNWEAVGFKVTLKSVPSGVFFSTDSPDGTGKFFADVMMYTSLFAPDPTDLLRVSFGTAFMAGKANNWDGQNEPRYSSPDYDKIIADLTKETDESRRNALAIAANDYLVKNVVTIPLVSRTYVTSGVSKALRGVSPSGWDSEMYNIADWSK